MFADAANIGINPTVTSIAPIDCVNASALVDSDKKNGGTVTNSKNMDALVRLPDQIGCSDTWDRTWYPTANIRAKGTQPDAMISAIQTVPVHPRDSPRALLTLLKRRTTSPSIMNHEGTDTGDSPRFPKVISELTNRLITRSAETSPYNAIWDSP